MQTNYQMKTHLIIIPFFAAPLCSCSGYHRETSDTIHLISWGGIGADKADTLYSLAKECGFDMHLALHMILPSQLLHTRTEHAFCVDVYDIAGWRLVGWCD